jgi:glycosyltransferase involved in cell wall biosynthesis
MNRSVLIVTPFFAPQNHSAVFRAYKLAKYLPQFGWLPIVLTVDTQYEFTEDSSLLADLPDEVEVVPTRYVEPTLRGLRMAFGGRNRTFSATRDNKANGHTGATASIKTAAIQKAYRSLIANWVHSPDAYWTWARTAAAAGKRILKERRIDLVLTTAPPFSSLMVGQALKSAGAKWIADFRDPLAYTQRLSSDSAYIYQRQRNIVRNALKNSDAVTVAASCFNSIYFDMFGRQRIDPVFIPTGMDPNLLDSELNDVEQKSGPPFLLFAGEYLADYDTAFLEAFATAVRQPGIKKRGVKLLVVGTLELNRRRMVPLIERFGLGDDVEFIDQIPQRQVYKLLKKAVAGVLIPGSHAYWWTTFAKMTDYIGMRKPVIAVVPDPSEARAALTRSGLGIFLDGSPADRAITLIEFLQGRYELPKPDEFECERYTVGQQVQSFVDVFEHLSFRN